jgi:hypothetical protein
MDIVSHYGKSLDQSRDVLNSLAKNVDSLSVFSCCHDFLIDFYELEKIIHEKPESGMLLHAIKEYEYSLISLSNGHYRHAFISLRLFFELSLSSIQFSAHEIDYLKWEQSKKDINWSSIVDPNNGIFSVNFIDAFCPELRDDGKQFRAISEAVYRECSEYVHGNARTHNSNIHSIDFSEDLHNEWCSKAKSVNTVFLFCFTARYIAYLEKCGTADALNEIASGTIGHLSGFQALYMGDK